MLQGTGLLEFLSSLLGWAYTFSWGISFYPQVILNYKRKSVRGVSLDFLVLNVLGFLCYSISTGALLFSRTVRNEYSYRHRDEGADPHPNVRINDLAFALHALLLSLITWVQSWVYTRDSTQRISPATKVLIVIFGCVITVQTLWTWKVERGLTRGIEKLNGMDTLLMTGHSFLDLVTTLSSIKVTISIAKYMPQLFLNFKRKSTIGWSIGNILLDLLGGVLSLTQMVLDAGISDDWTNLTSNPGKLGISLVSIGFDFLFMIQHYILYRNRSRLDDENEVRGYRHVPLDDTLHTAGHHGRAPPSSP